MSDVENEILIENAKIIYPNFEGRATPYRPAGTRDFSVRLDEELAKGLLAQGWNVKAKVSKEDPEDILYHLPVTVRFDGRPPAIWFVTSKGRTKLTEDLVSMIDFMIDETTNVDLKIRPYDWKMKSTGATGRKAYLKIAYFTLHEDPIHAKYEGVPDLDLASLQTNAPLAIEASDGIIDGEVVSETEEYPQATH